MFKFATYFNKVSLEPKNLRSLFADSESKFHKQNIGNIDFSFRMKNKILNCFPSVFFYFSLFMIMPVFPFHALKILLH